MGFGGTTRTPTARRIYSPIRSGANGAKSPSPFPPPRKGGQKGWGGGRCRGETDRRPLINKPIEVIRSAPPPAIPDLNWAPVTLRDLLHRLAPATTFRRWRTDDPGHKSLKCIKQKPADKLWDGSGALGRHPRKIMYSWILFKTVRVRT